MTFTTLLLFAVASLVMGVLGVREHRALREARRNLLHACAPLLDASEIRLGGDDFPRLRGTYRGTRVDAELIPDTMTIRRLPQLWLSVTLLRSLPLTCGFAALVRPSGNDFYSLTHGYDVLLTPPAGLPWEVIVRGDTAGSQDLVDRLATCVGAILADPKVKEVAVTPRGVRIVRQAGEGRRGEHLILRQAMFDDAAVPADVMTSLIAALEELGREATAKPAAARVA